MRLVRLEKLIVKGEAQERRWRTPSGGNIGSLLVVCWPGPFVATEKGNICCINLQTVLYNISDNWKYRYLQILWWTTFRHVVFQIVDTFTFQSFRKLLTRPMKKTKFTMRFVSMLALQQQVSDVHRRIVTELDCRKIFDAEKTLPKKVFYINLVSLSHWAQIDKLQKITSVVCNLANITLSQ